MIVRSRELENGLAVQVRWHRARVSSRETRVPFSNDSKSNLYSLLVDGIREKEKETYGVRCAV